MNVHFFKKKGKLVLTGKYQDLKCLKLALTSLYSGSE